MRTLIILRGAPASGKSSWIKDHCLQYYTLSSDDLRLLVQSPATSLEGNLTITSKNDTQVWKLLYNLLEDKMRRGEFVIVDATHYTNKSMSKYKDLINKYRYRAYYIDFSEGLSLEEHLERNRKRVCLKQVPDEVIIKMYNQLQNQEPPSSTFKKLSKNDAIYVLLLDYSNMKIDLTNDYDDIVVFGDIHGCYNPIKDYFDKHPYNEKTCYYSLGDLLDRGLQNKEVLEWACDMLIRKNFFVIEGNHERNVRFYANNELDKCASYFKEDTLPQIKDVDIKKVKELSNRLLQMAWFKFGDKEYLLTHGGIPCLPSMRMATSEMINGVGQYGDVENIYKAWDKNTNNTVQLHGHRNLTMLPAKISDYMYNLNDEIEWGGYLRVATIHKDGNIDIELFKNDLYTLRARKASTERVFNSDNVFIQRLNDSNLVNKKCLKDGVVSFNFTRDAFNDSRWNELTVKARGLFIDSQTDDIVARGFVKFFQVNEVKETTIPELKKNLQFPVKAYFKENGFLGLISWHKRENKPFIASKSTNEGDFADLVREYFYKLPLIKQSILLEFIRKNDCTLVFEVVDPERDPHIIKYNSPEFVLLAGIKNKLEDEYIPYEELVKLVNDCNYADDEGILSVKRFDRQFDNWEEFYSFFTSVEKDFTIEHEGWVFEDANNFMLKFKTPFYKFWKQMRSVKERIMNEKEVKHTGNELADKVIDFMVKKGGEWLSDKSIIDVRERFSEDE
jgi:predicted kinase